jgi:Flp pilus assembly protein TadB
MVVYRRLEFRNAGLGTRLGAFLLGLLGLGIAIALFVFALGVALVLLPVVIVAVLIGRWRWKKAVAEAEKRAGPRRGGEGPVLDLDYEVVDREPRR